VTSSLASAHWRARWVGAIVAGEIEAQLATLPRDRATLALFGEQASTIVNAIDVWQ